MIRILFSLAGTVLLFAFAAVAGMASFLVFGDTDGDGSPDRHARSASQIDSGPSVPFDAEPSLLARTSSPVDLGGDALGVLYILQRDGEVIRVGNEGGPMSVATRFAEFANEETDETIGFSAIAFHPHYLIKEKPGFGKFYVVVAEKSGTANPDFIPEFGYENEHHQDVIYEFSTEHPLAANFRGDRREVIRFSQPGPKNNLRSLAFDHRGLLYLAIGDGAVTEVGRRSPSRNASSLTSAYGKVLRIDPTGRSSFNGNYGIPESNPFQLVSEALPELWAFGLRSPHSLSFDPFRGVLCIGESSHDGLEKVNVSEYGGEHFGWDLTESSPFFNIGALAQLEEIMTPPTLELRCDSGTIGRNAGNVVYRGENFPSLAGRLVFASDDGRLLVSETETTSSPTSPYTAPRELGLRDMENRRFSALRSGPSGELILLCENGAVYELRKTAEIGAEKNPDRTMFCFVSPTREAVSSH
jgi:hypothetical protein